MAQLLPNLISKSCVLYSQSWHFACSLVKLSSNNTHCIVSFSIVPGLWVWCSRRCGRKGVCCHAATITCQVGQVGAP